MTKPPPSPRKPPAWGRIGGAGAWDMAAVAASFQITMLEGIEVVFIVIAIGAGGAGLLMPASLGALAALLVVIALGLAVHRPLANMPENSLKFVVGVLLRRSAHFGSGRASPFPGRAATGPSRSSIAGFLLTAALTIGLCRSRLSRSLPIVAGMENA